MSRTKKTIDWLDRNETIIRSAFRLIVIAMLSMAIALLFEAISIADAAHDKAYDANDYAQIAAKEAATAAENSDACRVLRYR